MKPGAALLLAMAIGGATPALAAPSIVCTDGDSASAEIVVADADATTPSRVRVSVDDRDWTTDSAAAPGETLTLGPSSITADQVQIDLNDSKGAAAIKLRLSKAAEKEAIAVGGTLWVKAVGAYALTCMAPG
ncbi:MAG: hypothetical protein JWN11_822 [Hyphomicrobiales bacterium]|nr:hypothetical protein [Hyphomicrobiales bacterium]